MDDQYREKMRDVRLAELRAEVAAVDRIKVCGLGVLGRISINGCGHTFPVSEFSINRSAHDGFNSLCRACTKRQFQKVLRKYTNGG